jgi:hypothetical protein
MMIDAYPARNGTPAGAASLPIVISKAAGQVNRVPKNGLGCDA